MTEDIRLPDGKGGWTTVPAGTSSKMDVKKQEQVLAKAQAEDYFKRVGQCAEFINKTAKMFANDHGLTPQEVAAAMYLENCNMRFFFPEEFGGMAEYDRITTGVWEWFREQTKG